MMLKTIIKKSTASSTAAHAIGVQASSVLYRLPPASTRLFSTETPKEAEAQEAPQKTEAASQE